MNLVFFRTSWPALLYPYAPNVAGGFGVSFGGILKRYLEHLCFVFCKFEFGYCKFLGWNIAQVLLPLIFC